MSTQSLLTNADTLFIMTPNWKQPKYLPTVKWINCGMSILWNTTLELKGMNYTFDTE